MSNDPHATEGSDLPRRLFEVTKSESQESEEAWADVWPALFPHIERAIRKGTSRLADPVSDSEDLAASALRSFVRTVQNEKYDLSTPGEVWGLLIKIARRKIGQKHRRSQRKMSIPRDQLAGGEATSELSAFDLGAKLAAEIMIAISELPDKTLQSIAYGLMEGLSVQELATNLDITVHLLKTKIDRIRQLWTSFE